MVSQWSSPREVVGQNDWGFRKEQEGKITFRRYIGPPSFVVSPVSPTTGIPISPSSH